MAVLVAPGSYLPKGLTFGPTNGPEDFQELVFIIFARRLYKEWFLFLDDMSVATGRPPPHGPGPSGAHDVVNPHDFIFEAYENKDNPEQVEISKVAIPDANFNITNN